ncbi:glycosyltransferase [Microbacterium sp. 179-I 3D3 NHS]|uniref:glycosyltransferase n=1 Tax=Microbacterium sp. 179-I 3D3 NHS TaxID=3142382 RepID=UPI0039A10D53
MTASVLVSSFTDISKDPRAIKQVEAAVERHAVTTCSFGPPPHPSVEHIELDPAGSYPTNRVMQQVDAFARKREIFRWTHDRIPYVREARRALRGRRFDAVIANNADAALAVRPVVGGVPMHIDLHEYFPGLVFDDGTAEARRQQRYLDWLLRRVVPFTTSSSAVSPLIAQRYRSLGLDPEVITNAGPSLALAPGEVGSPIRLVHSGNAQPGRGLRQLVRAVTRTRTDVTLDLYLVPNDVRFHTELSGLAAEAGERVALHPPVPREALVPTLNGRDVGVFVLPPTTENGELALPNKFFDFVQARLAVIVGPSPEMADLTRRHGLGVVTDDFTEDALVAALDQLTPEGVRAGKQAADHAAVALSGDAHRSQWEGILERLTGTTASA